MSNTWTIDDQSANEAKKNILTNSAAVKKWDRYISDVGSNPFFHQKHRRIMKLRPGANYPSNTWRYSNTPLRVVYYPDKPSKTVYTLSAGTHNTADYKHRSKKK